MSSIKFIDKVPGQAEATAWILQVMEPTLTAHEILRRRVYEEVLRFNAQQQKAVFQGLVQPTDTERVLNGYKLRKQRPLDWQEQFAQAVQAFQRRGFLLIVGDRQVESLDEELTVAAETEVTFLKLVPLVGG